MDMHVLQSSSPVYQSSPAIKVSLIGQITNVSMFKVVIDSLAVAIIIVQIIPFRNVNYNW